MSNEIDLDYRPATYFRPEKLEKYLLSKVKGSVLREKLAELFKNGRHAEFRELLDDATSDADRKMLERYHPMFMGGNYLPDTEDGEVEIARIRIKSTTFDVTCVYARPENGSIYYRVVDEYGGDTLQGPAEATTTQPMTLGEFTNFFLTAWPLMEVLEMNFEDEVEGALDFFSADSEFYPELDRLCRRRVRDHFPKPEQGDECPYCEYFNSPPAGDTCEHAAAWVWDGQIEGIGEAQEFVAAVDELSNLVGSAEATSTIELVLEALAEANPTRAKLISTAADGLEEVLSVMVNGQSGDGWSTGGALGGSGYTLYVSDPEALAALASECRSIIRACAMKIQTEDSLEVSLESLRAAQTPKWQLVRSGFWSQNMYHSGHIAYYIANTGPGTWLLDGVVRNTILDDVTEEDVEEGRLNDDQIQAMWGMTLSEAQDFEYRQIRAACSGASEELSIKEMAKILYETVCLAGGHEITEPDDISEAEGLLTE